MSGLRLAEKWLKMLKNCSQVGGVSGNNYGFDGRRGKVGLKMSAVK